MISFLFLKVTIPVFAIIFYIQGNALFSCKYAPVVKQIVEVSGDDSRIKLVKDEGKKKVDIFIDDKLFTSYIYPNTIKKPVLYPLITPMGTKITRKYPLEPSKGERVDHLHHIGLWFNYGDVNGLDFWNNSESIMPEKRDGYGTIVHNKIIDIQNGEEQASLEVEMDWLTPDGKVLLVENTTFVFRGGRDEFSVDRITQLTAPHQKVSFKDNKEGMLGIRVTRALEHPTDKPILLTNEKGVPGLEPILNNVGVNGNYLNSNGIEGVECWGKRAKWVNLRSTISKETISLVIMDHPSNVGYPTYWHARGYGLFAANPLGQEVFSKGKEKLDFKLGKGEKVLFKHRIIVASKNLERKALDDKLDEFSKNYSSMH